MMMVTTFRNLIDPGGSIIRYIYLGFFKIIFSTLTPDFRDTIIFIISMDLNIA